MRDSIKIHSLVPRLLFLVFLIVGYAVIWHWLQEIGALRILFGVFFAGAALFVLLEPDRVILDRSARRVLLCSMLRTSPVGDFDEVREVLVGRETRGGGKNRQTVFPVRLSLPERTSEMAAPQDYLEARRLSESLARGLEVDIVDAGQGQAEHRSHRVLDARWAETAPVPEGPLPPPPAGLELLSPLPRLAVRLPRALPALLMRLVLALFILLAFFWNLRGLAALPGALFALFLLIEARSLVACVGTTSLEASTGSLVIRYRLGFLSWRRTIDLSRLEEIRLATRGLEGGLALLSDHRIDRVLSRLEEEQLEWLKAALAKAVRG